jgi:hypothetical protein
MDALGERLGALWRECAKFETPDRATGHVWVLLRR